MGYLPGDSVAFTLLAAGNASPVSGFSVRDAATGRLLLRGAFAAERTLPGIGYAEAGSLSGLKSPTAIRITADGSTTGPIKIQKAMYEPVYRASLHTFSVLRSGVAINDESTGIAHPASHLKDAVLEPSGVRRDLRGGWYNAGDYGKWTMMTAIAAAYMLQLYALQAADSPQGGDPQLLSTAAWGLAWLLKMQNADGGVLHKVDSGTHFAWGLPPQEDTHLRIATPASSLDTADFAAVMYEAQRVLRPTDPAAGRRYGAAADRAWIWLQKHPDQPASDPFYPDNDARQEELWALCEHVLAHPARNAENALARRIAHAPGREVTGEVSWADPSMLGMFSVARAPYGSAALRRLASRRIVEASRADEVLCAQSPFGVALGPDEYTWGSVERVLDRAALLLMANAVSPDIRLREAALDQLHYVLGRNPLGYSFVVGFGSRSVQHPYHWTYMALHRLLPGWAVGGPNGSPLGADAPLLRLQQAGTPPPECYLDLCSRAGSWASNEGQISEEAALVFVSGYLNSIGNADRASPHPASHVTGD